MERTNHLTMSMLFLTAWNDISLLVPRRCKTQRRRNMGSIESTAIARSALPILWSPSEQERQSALSNCCLTSSRAKEFQVLSVQSRQHAELVDSIARTGEIRGYLGIRFRRGNKESNLKAFCKLSASLTGPRHGTHGQTGYGIRANGLRNTGHGLRNTATGYGTRANVYRTRANGNGTRAACAHRYNPIRAKNGF